MTILTFELDPITKLTLGLVEGTIHGCVWCLEFMVARRCVARDDLVLWEAEVDRDVVALSVAVMMSRQIEYDVAGDDAVEEVIELFGACGYVGRKRVGVRHVSERELDGALHSIILCTIHAH